MKSSIFRLFFAVLLFGGGVLAVAAPPAWWTNGNPPVIDAGAAANNKGPANIGQAKWMAKSALEALRAVDPDCAEAIEADLVGPEKVIPNWNAPVTDEEKAAQHAPLLIGQLKAISAPFYDHLHTAAPDWLANERVLNGTSNAGTHYPWTLVTEDDTNKAVANIGQLKAVFSFRFETLPAISAGYEEWVVAQFGEGTTTGPEDDPDRDGLTNLEEYHSGLIPHQSDSDGDGYSDQLAKYQTLHLKFNKDSGHVVEDSSPYERHGETIRSPQWQSSGGIDEGGIRFDGNNDGVRMPSHILSDQSDLTISFWFKTSDNASNQPLFEGSNFQMGTEISLDLENGNLLRFHTGRGNFVEWSIGRNLANGLWHHVVLTRDAEAGSVTLYLDGGKISSFQNIDLLPLFVDRFVIGLNYDWGYEPLRSFVGVIDEFRINSCIVDLEGVSGSYQSGYLSELFQLNDSDHDTLPDDWENQVSGNLSTLLLGNGDYDQDGLTNRREFEIGSNPVSYFNGTSPMISVVSGHSQTIYSSESTPLPIVFQVTDNGVPLANVPVELRHPERMGLVKPVQGGNFANSVILRSDSQGKVSVIFKAN